MLVLVPSQVSNEALCPATSPSFVPHPRARIPPPAGRRVMHAHRVQHTKMRLWTLDTRASYTTLSARRTLAARDLRGLQRRNAALATRRVARDAAGVCAEDRGAYGAAHA